MSHLLYEHYVESFDGMFGGTVLLLKNGRYNARAYGRIDLGRDYPTLEDARYALQVYGSDYGAGGGYATLIAHRKSIGLK